MFPSVSLDLDFLDGFLAGDGSIERRAANARAKMSTSKPGYAEYIRQRLSSMGFSAHICTYFRQVHMGRSRPGGYMSHRMYSYTHPLLTEQFRRWYPDGVKRFPPDFRLSPDSLLQWYLGDGSLGKGRAARIVVADFCVPDYAALISSLVALFGSGVKLHQGVRSTHLIYFGGDSSPHFFSYVGPCPVSDYSYRWPKEKANA